MTVSDEVRANQSTADADSSAEGDRSSTDGDRPPADGSGAREGRASTDGGSAAVDGERSSVTVYRWTCPICGESRTGMASGSEDPLGKAEFSLRQHVQTSEDDGHGPANLYPPGFDPDAVGRAVSVE